MKTLLIRAIVLGLLVLFSWLAWKEAQKPERPARSQVTVEGAEPEPVVEPEGGYRNSLQVFIYILIVAFSGGVVVLKWVVPAIGDRIGETFYSAPEKAEQTPTQKAMALVAQGEYHKALAAFGKILEDTPNDRFALMESAKIYQDKLGDSESAVQLLEGAVAGEWPEDDKGFFLIKLADMHSTHRHDFARAKEVLEQLMSNFPESHHAANAHHKLREIEEAEFLARTQAHGHAS